MPVPGARRRSTALGDTHTRIAGGFPRGYRLPLWRAPTRVVSDRGGNTMGKNRVMQAHPGRAIRFMGVIRRAGTNAPRVETRRQKAVRQPP